MAVSNRPADAGWPPDETADPLLIARSYLRANWGETATHYLLIALIERIDLVLRSAPSSYGGTEHQ